MAQMRMKDVIEQELKPIMADLFQRMAGGGLDLKVDGTPAYNEKAQFVGGKVINLGCYTALELLKTEESLTQLGDLIRMVHKMPMETWGILNGITGLYRLQKAGLLEKVVDQDTLEVLKISMDWRTFIDIEDHYALIKKPTNYYGVAFGIARYRELLGWEPEGHSAHLLERLMEHIDQYSGQFSYMDETPGDGRFDRYSILVPGEMTALIMGTGWEVPEKIQKMLNNSAHIFLQLANEKGWGFSYGRSIGPYGDTAALEVLSSAARLGSVLTKEETDLAYGYCIKLAQHVAEYWYDPEMRSINMWEKGRKTDNYRNKNRILGENLSLCMQVVNCYEHWVSAGYENQELSDDFGEKLAALAPYTVVKFAEGDYARGLAIVRDGKHVWSLPLISGGRGGYFDRDAYLPVPFQNGVLQGVPEHCHGNMVPQLIMENGDIYMPIAWLKTIDSEITAEKLSISYTIDTLCKLGDRRPERVEGTSAEVHYTFENHRIHREDVFHVGNGQKVKEVRLTFLTFSGDPVMDGMTESGAGGRKAADGCGIRFGRGVVSSMKAAGYETCEMAEALTDGSCDTPCGRLNYMAQWSTTDIPEEGEIRVSWTLGYEE